MAVTLIEACHHLRVTNSDEDWLIEELINVATTFIEKKVNISSIDNTIVDQAILLLLSFYYLHRGDPTEEHAPPTPNAWRSSGAASLLSPWTVPGSALI